MMTAEQNTVTLHIREIPIDLKAAYKAHCARRGNTMKNTIEKHMRDTINPPKK